MQVASHSQGLPCWFELETTDEAAALRFYGALFGWSDDPQPLPGGSNYHMQRLGSDAVAAVQRQRPDQAQMGIPPHWNVYLSADDVDAVAAAVPGLGGRVMAPPFDVMEFGRMAVITDPTGAVVCLWQPRAHIGSGRVSEPGAMTWAELVTPDPSSAAGFFTALLGLRADSMEMGPGQEPYTLLAAEGGEARAGLLKLTPDMGPMPPAWVPYFDVSAADAAASGARDNGGNVIAEPFEVPGVGRIAWLQDPQGAVFGVIEPLERPL